MAEIILYPSALDTENSAYYGISSSYPASAVVGKGVDNTGYGVGINLLRTANSVTKAFLNFNVSQIPENVVISSVKCDIAIYGSTTLDSRTSSKTVQLCKETTPVGASVNFSCNGATATPSITDGGSWARGELNNIKLLVSATINQTVTANTYMYIRGANLTITYTDRPVGETHTITVTSHIENLTVSPIGNSVVEEGTSFTVTMAPSSAVTAITDNGVNVLSQLVVNQGSSGGSETLSNVLGTYKLVSGSFNTGNNSGATYFSGRVGKGYDATTSTTNYYSSSSSSQVVFQYDVSFSNIPSNAIITRAYLKATGKCESTSQSSEYMCVQLKSGNTGLTDQYNWKNSGDTSVSTQTIECTTLPTIAQLGNLVVECTLGYYGGNITGATVYVEYSIPAAEANCTYTILSVNEDHHIVIGNSGGGGEEPQSEEVNNYYFTGAVETITLSPGKYKLECWGAQGGSYSSYAGGLGGYSVGTITLAQSTTCYLYIGGQPAENSTSQAVTSGGFNGGGNGQNRYYSSVYTYGQGGGGGTDIRIGQDSLYARVIVAGGGGGSASNASDNTNTKYGGGLTGGAGGASSSASYIAGQTSSTTSNYYKAGTFGQGAAAYTSRTNYQCGSGGGGGGWYGGYAYNYAQDSQTDLQTYNGGGSGYVYTSSTASNYPSGCMLNASYYLTDAQTIGGNAAFPATNGGTETGHKGNGFIKITKIVEVTSTNLFFKINNAWKKVLKVFIKNNGNWEQVEASELDQTSNYLLK